MNHYQNNIQQACEAALSYISSQQQADGGFLTIDAVPSVFFTALIANCLTPASLPSSSIIIKKMIDFLLYSKNERWVWHYNERYPPDLDDTSVALQAIYANAPEHITAEAMAGFTSILWSQEKSPGGPYQTWIIPEKNTQWSDIDIVVNSNVAAFLSLLDIQLPALEAYFDQYITMRQFQSRYYDHSIVIIYFLSRQYNGQHKDILKEELLRQRQPEGHWGNALHTALAITALLRLGETLENLLGAITYLSDASIGGRWPTTHLFIERIEKDAISYAACRAFVSACCMEALAAYQTALLSPLGPALPEAEELFIETVLQQCRIAVAAPLLSQQIDQALTILLQKDPDHEIMLLPYHFAKGLLSSECISEDIIVSLAVANTLGWIGYTIYDDLLDGDNKIHLLPLAHACTRKTEQLLSSILSPIQSSNTVVRILDDIDAATLWEHLHCKVQKQDEYLILPAAFPDYENFDVLAEKSLGHALGPIILCLLAGEDDQAGLTELFFREYLIARQLNDDAHDWLSDLQNGFLNSVSVGILQDWHNKNNTRLVNIDGQEEVLRQYFWDEHIDAISDAILEHVTNARLILKKITLLKEVTFLEKLIAPLEHSARQAVRERNDAKRFLEAIERSW